MYLIGYGSDIAAANRGSGQGALQLKNSSLLSFPVEWQTILQPDLSLPSKTHIVQRLAQELSLLTVNAVLEKKFFVVIGGDHTSAIGTWSGVHHAKQAAGPVGLIWIDAHLDSHTPQTSESGNLHGMPLAILLGKGDSLLTTILKPVPKLQPENVCIIGARSYEAGELALIKQLNIRVFFMDEVKQRGMSAVLQEAIQLVTRNTSCYGISLDIDSIDPKDAPGTGVCTPEGIPGDGICEAFKLIKNDPRLIGMEIVEFDPSRDKNQLTEKLIVQMLQTISRK